MALFNDLFENNLFNGKNKDDLFSDLIAGFSDLNIRVTDVNKSLLLNRDRVNEISKAIADTAPDVLRLGGSVQDTVDTIIQASESLGRTVITTGKDVSELYASAKILDDSVRNIVSSFNNVGFQLSNISGLVEESINYVQSIGGNAKLVMKDVLGSMDMMNRFNFENGVQGITKMAARASMLKLDMGKIESFADRLLDPQGAIETASAFQRLGVAAGGLVDPFSLMYKSINDPEGLQESIIDLTRRFVNFNEETGDFKINPAGILQMRELSQVIGMDFKEFSRTALAAADLEKRLSEISFDYGGDQEDLTLLANLAQFKGGEYVVTIDNKEKSLSEVTEQEFIKLRELQEKQPKTVEDIARSQLDIQSLIQSDLNAIKLKFVYGITSTTEIQNLIEGFRKLENVLGSGAYEGTPKTSEIRDMTSETIQLGQKIGQGWIDGFSGTLTEDKINEIEKFSDDLINKFEATFSTSIGRGYDVAMSKLDKDDKVDKFVYDLLEKSKTSLANMGVNFSDKSKSIEKSITETKINGNYDLNFKGEIKHNVDVPVGLDKSKVQEILNKQFDSQTFKDRIYQIISSYPENLLPKKEK